MSMQEMHRLIFGLRKLGLYDTRVLNFLLWVESGAVEYEPQPLNEQKRDS